MSNAGALMTHRCQLQRSTDYGVSDNPTFSDLGAPIMCRVWANTGRETVSPEKTTVVEDLRAVVPLGTDVTVLDRITSVKDRNNGVIEARQMSVQAVHQRDDHVELALEYVSS